MKRTFQQIYCYRQSHNVATRGPHEQNDLDQKMIQKLRSAFKQADRDGSGTISTGGAYHALSMIFPTYTLPNFEDTLEQEREQRELQGETTQGDHRRFGVVGPTAIPVEEEAPLMDAETRKRMVAPLRAAAEAGEIRMTEEVLGAFAPPPVPAPRVPPVRRW